MLLFEVSNQISASTLAKWVPKCATEEAQDKAYQQMKTNYAKKNGNALRILIQNNEKFKKNVRNTQGARTRIEKLLDNAEEFKTLMHFCENDIRNKEVFTDEWLMNWYLAFLNNFQTMDPPERFAYVLFLSYSVFVRWMDHQTDPQNVNLPFGLRQIYEQIWKGERVKLEQFANEKIIEENTWDELMYIYSLITEVFEKIKEFVEKKRNEKNLGKIGIEIAKRNAKNSPLRQQNQQKEPIERNGKLLAQWKEIWTKGEQMAQQFTMESIKTECPLTEWIQTLHFDALADLMERKGMRNQLEMGIQKHRNWLTLFMDEGRAERIQKMIKLNDEEFAEMRKNQKEGKREESEEQKKYEENFEKLQKEWEEKEEEEAKQRKKEKEKEAKEKKKAKGQNLNKIKKKKSGKTPKRAGKSWEEMNLANQKISDEAEEDEGKKWEESEKSSELFNNWALSATEETEMAETNGQLKQQNTNESDANAIEIGEREEEDGLENAMAHICLNDFINENYLMTTYEEFLEEPNDLGRKILDIGIYFYEISNRIFAEKEMKKNIYIFEKNEHKIIYQEEKLKEINQKWENILQKNEMKTAKMGRNEWQKMKENLLNLLKEIIFVTEGIEKTNERKMDKKEEEKEIKSTKYQMHRNNLANAIARSAKGKSGQIWAKWDEQRRTEVLMMLFEKDTKKRTTANLLSQFGTHLEGWHKMQEQQQIDQFTINEHKNYVKNKMTNHADRIEAEQIDNLHSVLLPQLNQQIFFNENNDEDQIKKLEQILIENRCMVPMDSNKALEELRIIVSNWSQGEAKLLQIGSVLLGTNTATSDIDIIYIMPQKGTKTGAINQFFGIFKCDLAQRKCEGNSFYCILCLDENVRFLQKFPKAYIPLIKMNFLGIEFDILFVAIPTINALPDEPMTQNDVMALMQILADQTEPDEKMIKSLAGHASNGHIKRLLGRKMFQKFRKIVASLKFWAKSNYIYGTQFGFFNGISLSIMATKVSLLYPNASVPFLLNRFFLIFASWDWPVPLRLAEYVPNEFQKFSWTPKDEEEKRNSSLLMPIITPGYLEQNGMYQMNKSTFKIVQKSMREAFLKVRQIQSLADDQNWTHLFPFTKFTKKYKHYAAVCCIVTNLIHLDQFCDFVERRIRLQLLHFDDVTDQVNFTHIKAENEGKFECPHSILMPVLEQNRTFSMHKAWLLGIELEDEIAENIYKSAEDGQKEELIKSLNLNLSAEFDKIILRDYSKKLNGWFQPIALHSKYVDGTELEKTVTTD